MPKNIRVIPRLDIKGPNLVKGIHLEGLRVLGNPERFARYYCDNGADEIIYMDVVASLYQRNSLHELISKTARECFIPMTVGGGIRTIDDIRRILNAGADKVAINTAATANPSFISEAARCFGSSTIIIAIEAIRQPDGEYLAFTDSGREFTGLEVLAWAKKAEELGAGEIMITSIDREGTGEGFDVPLAHKISGAVSIPVIAHGGADKPSDVAEVVEQAGVDAVAIASALHYKLIKEGKIDFSRNEEGNVVFLDSLDKRMRITGFEMDELKAFMDGRKINCRIEHE